MAGLPENFQWRNPNLRNGLKGLEVLRVGEGWTESRQVEQDQTRLASLGQRCQFPQKMKGQGAPRLGGGQLGPELLQVLHQLQRIGSFGGPGVTPKGGRPR